MNGENQSPDPALGSITPAAGQPALPKRRSPLAAMGAALLAVLAKFKFLLVFLKTGGTMLLSIWVYGLVYGWKFAVGFVLLIFIHECGHLVLARMFGLKVGAPVFIPFMGAIIALKEAPSDAWMEAWVGIGGPLFGALGSLLCLGIFGTTGDRLFLALAYSGFWLNLFNLAPIPPLDGGRIAGAISPWLWIAGVAILCGMLFFHFNFIVLIVVIAGIPRVWKTLTNRSRLPDSYFALSATRRWTIAVLYFGLAALLTLGMKETYFRPQVQPAPTQAAF
jgi:Zn-dependent protease